jgi:SAM-dependent methyltransferase
MNDATDSRTAECFSNSWNNVFNPSVYTFEQFKDWISPWDPEEMNDCSIIELGVGSGALLYHFTKFNTKSLTGIDLGSSVRTAKHLLGKKAKILQRDATDSISLFKELGAFDRTYCIGVLHHLNNPEEGVETLIKLTKPGGKFHGWVYASEGNFLIRILVDPIRNFSNKLNWKITKYCIAMPLSIPFYIYSKFCLFFFTFSKINLPVPLFKYMLWVGKRGFKFHHHVAFDQLVTPVTHYITRNRINSWLDDPRIDPSSKYIIFRNGNSWKFGGTITSNYE